MRSPTSSPLFVRVGVTTPRQSTQRKLRRFAHKLMRRQPRYGRNEVAPRQGDTWLGQGSPEFIGYSPRRCRPQPAYERMIAFRTRYKDDLREVRAFLFAKYRGRCDR